MQRSKIALITVGCLMSLVSLAACSSEESASPDSGVNRPVADAVILPPRRVTQTPNYVRPNVPSYTAQPVQPRTGGYDPNFGNGLGNVLNQSNQVGADVLRDFNREVQSAPSRSSTGVPAPASPSIDGYAASARIRQQVADSNRQIAERNAAAAASNDAQKTEIDANGTLNGN